MLKSRLKGDKKLIALTPDMIDPSPYQPRKEFDYYELLELSKSIKENGMIQPVTVRKKNDRYELISGERRLRAAAIAGLKTVPAIVVSATDRECSLMCLIENIQRTDLNFFEEAKGLKKLMDDFDLSGLEVAERIGMAQSTLSNKLRLLRLSSEQQERIVFTGLSERHARALLKLEEEDRDEVLNKIIAEQLSVKETEDYIAAFYEEPEKPSCRPPLRRGHIGDLRIFSNSLSKMLGTIRKSGVDATSRKKETEDYIEYTITIPKGRKKEDRFKIIESSQMTFL